MSEKLKEDSSENNQSTKEQISIKDKIKKYLLNIFKSKKKKETQLNKKSEKKEADSSKEKSCILTNLLEKLAIERDARIESNRRHSRK